MTTIALRNFDGANRRARPQPDCTCFVCSGPAKLLRSMTHPDTGKQTAGCEACYQKSQHTSAVDAQKPDTAASSSDPLCQDCGAPFLANSPKHLLCDGCLEVQYSVGAFLFKWEHDYPRITREIVNAICDRWLRVNAMREARQNWEAEQARVFYRLQRLALPPGEAISVTMPAEQPIAVPLATIVLDARMHQHAALDSETAYQVRVDTVKRGIPKSKPAPSVIDITPRIASKAAWNDEATAYTRKQAGALVAMMKTWKPAAPRKEQPRVLQAIAA
jgi:hypothetical protein